MAGSNTARKIDGFHSRPIPRPMRRVVRRHLPDPLRETPCEALFERLSQQDPRRLADLIEFGDLKPADLTFAAEAMGKSGDAGLARRTLLPLLEDPSPVVREGAIYGLAGHIDDHVRQRLIEVAGSDPSPGVKSAAQDALDP